MWSCKIQKKGSIHFSYYLCLSTFTFFSGKVGRGDIAQLKNQENTMLNALELSIRTGTVLSLGLASSRRESPPVMRVPRDVLSVEPFIGFLFVGKQWPFSCGASVSSYHYNLTSGEVKGQSLRRNSEAAGKINHVNWICSSNSCTLTLGRWVSLVYLCAICSSKEFLILGVMVVQLHSQRSSLSGNDTTLVFIFG